MIKYPKMKSSASCRQVIDKFKGYNHNLRIGSGEFYEMENLTSDDYPVLSVRKKRGSSGNIGAPGYSTGMLYVPGTGFFVSANVQTPQGSDDPESGELYLLDQDGNAELITKYLTPDSKSFALMGDKLIVAPDMLWVSINTTKAGEHEYRQAGRISYTLEITSGVLNAIPCREDGSRYDNFVSAAEPPDNPVDLMVWADKSVYPCVFKQYSSVQEGWVTLSTTYIRIYGEGNAFDLHHFYPGDGITISGMGDDMAFLNGSHIIQNAGQGYIVIEGVVDGFHKNGITTPVLFERKVPALDYIVESGNRLWGCSKNTNEIYACKLGDYHNWSCFQGLSTDSWVGTIGTPGEFTGAAVQNGYPVFYKENCKHKVWPSATGAHQITTVPCEGVQKGSEKSVAVLDGTVFYKGASGVFADDGGGAVQIGHSLGDAVYSDASGAIYDGKYYLNMQGHDRSDHLFVYDIAKKLWHREEGVAGVLASGGGSLYEVSGGNITDLTGNTGTLEKDVSWFAVTGDLGLEIPEQKYISRLTLRLSLDPGATLEVYAQYDREQTWVKLGQVYGTDLRSFSLPVRPRRCDQLRLKLQGTGMCKIYSITKTLEKGSELP